MMRLLLFLYLLPISESLGISRGSASLIFSVAGIGSLLTSMVIGKLLTKIKPNILVVWGGLCVIVFFASIAYMRSIYGIYVLAFLFGTGTITAGFVMAQVSISQWFVKARGTVTSLAGVVMNIGCAVMIPVLASLIQKNGYGSVALYEGLAASTFKI